MNLPKEVNIKQPTQPHGFLARRYKGMPLGIYNKRGKMVLWVGGKYLPINGPALWLTLLLCLVTGFVGGRL